MKYLLLLLLLSANFSLADQLAKGQEDQLQEIVELFQSDSRGKALEQLEIHESNLVSAIRESEDAGAYMLLGRAYFYAEMDAKAKDSFNAALRFDPSLADAHFFVGLIHKYANDLDKAEKSFRSAIEQSGSDEKHFVELGRTLEMKSDTKSAFVAYQNALTIDENNFDANFNLATIYAIEGENENAEKYYKAALEQEPDDLDSNYNLGQLYQNTNQHRLALKSFSKVLELNALEWRAIAKIVQENQILEEFASRDAAIDSIYEVWRNDAVRELREQGFFIREQRQIDSGKLFVLEYFELKGERARKFVFKLQDVETGDNKFDVSLGSYDVTTEFSRANGEIGADERVYHLDGYAPNGSHFTYAFFHSVPDYEVVREMALKVFSGQLKAISSTVPTTARE